MSAQQQTVLLILDPMTCGTCGVVFGMEQNHKRKLVEQDGSFWCPNGHERVFCSETGYGKLQQKLKNVQKQKEWADQEANTQREHRYAAERREAAQKGAKTRLKNRIANGVCPCCTRHFSNLAAHIKTKHPEFRKGGDAT